MALGNRPNVHAGPQMMIFSREAAAAKNAERRDWENYAKNLQMAKLHLFRLASQ